MRAAGLPSSAAARWRCRPPRRGVRGRSTCRSSCQGRFVGEQTIDLVLLADPLPIAGAGQRPDSRFGVIATDLPFEGWGELPEILPLVSAGRVKLAVWSEAGDVQQTDSAGFDHV